MKFDFAVSLKDQALLKTADLLCNTNDIETLLTKYNRDADALQNTNYRKFQEFIYDIVRKSLIGKISNLSPPETIKEKLICVTKRVGFQKVEWYFHHKELWNIKKVPSVFYWTPHGTINRKKTSESLINDKTIHICERYSLACYYCFEKEIFELNKKISYDCWKRLGEWDDKDHGKMIKVWSQIIKSKEMEFVRQRCETCFERISYSAGDLWWGEKKSKVYAAGLVFSIKTANNIAAEYFWRKLNAEGRSLSARHCHRLFMGILNMNNPEIYFRPIVFRVNIALFLLKRMTRNQQMEVFREEPYKMAELFIDWPFQTLFLQVTNKFFRHTPSNTFTVLQAILMSDHGMCEMFNYGDLYTQVWHIFHASHKFDIDYTEKATRLIRCLLTAKHVDGIFLLLKHATPNLKEKLILNAPGMDICKYFALKDEWNLMQLFYETYLPYRPRVVITKFKAKLRRFLRKLKKRNISRIMNIIDNARELRSATTL